METAAERIRSAVKNILPERPHHLSLSPDRKYAVPPNFWQHQSPLQYSTFISDADRGVLLTRPYFDICDEPSPPLATPQPTRPTGPKKILNKMSFKDYQKQKKAASTSPTENGIPGKLGEKKASGVASKFEKDGSRKEQEQEQERSKEGDMQLRTNGEAERSKSLLSKLSSKDVPSPAPETKKRPLEPEDSVRPHKKTKPSEPSSDLLRRPLRPESPHGREQNSAHDKFVGKDGRSGASQSTSNGRLHQVISRESHRAVSPMMTVNGVKPHSSAHNSLPRKPDTSGKHLVPPLLSPLRKSLDDELETISPKKRAADGHATGKSQSKPQKPEVTTKKQKPATPDLPPLLSPTLPSVVEEALAKLQKTPSKGESSQAASQSSDSPNSTRKTRPRADSVDEDTRPDSYIVTLKYKKSSRKTVQRLLALPSRNKKERSASVENTPPPARKRPRPLEASADPAPSISAKRPKTSEATAIKAPLTPPKAAAPSSQTQTPGGRVAQTPNSGEAPPPSRDGGGQARKDVLKRREGIFAALGRKLKHERDKETQTNGAGPNGSGQGKRPDVDGNRGALLAIEMILAYLIAFRSRDYRSEMSGAPMDMTAWQSLVPHLRTAKAMTRHSPPLQALAVQLYGLLYNEMMRVYSYQSFQNLEMKLDANSAKEVFRTMGNHLGSWTEAEKLRGKVSDEMLKTPTMGPWTSPNRAASDALIVLARFAEREHVNWRAEVVPPKD